MGDIQPTRGYAPGVVQDGVEITLLQNIELDRSHDDVYSATTSVISCVMNMTQTATDKNVHLYVPLVKVRQRQLCRTSS